MMDVDKVRNFDRDALTCMCGRLELVHLIGSRGTRVASFRGAVKLSRPWHSHPMDASSPEPKLDRRASSFFSFFPRNRKYCVFIYCVPGLSTVGFLTPGVTPTVCRVDVLVSSLGFTSIVNESSVRVRRWEW
jgi:hypothetical protein